MRATARGDRFLSGLERLLYADRAMSNDSKSFVDAPPLRIFRHRSCEGPGYLGTFLDRCRVAYELVCIDKGIPVPIGLDGVSGLVFMGAAGSVNDPLDWIHQELELIRCAVEHEVPVLGICFGAQLMSKALGGEVRRGEQGMEIGWHPVRCVQGCDCDPWLDGLPAAIEVFHWHADTFTLPPGAVPLLESRCFASQGFVRGAHLALQFHLEMTEKMIRNWIRLYASDLEVPTACVQDAESITEGLEARLAALHEAADVIYGAWLRRAALLR
jgi:GMP synthase-like glutamine amidotransferase